MGWKLDERDRQTERKSTLLDPALKKILRMNGDIWISSYHNTIALNTRHAFEVQEARSVKGCQGFVTEWVGIVW
jgi:hypothetical protein